MPSAAKVNKQMILDCALQMLIRDGYEASKFKSLAKELGCATPPISWHFGRMEGLRKELTDYAQAYADKKVLSSAGMGMMAFINVSKDYIDIAFDEPNLFKFLYMSGSGGPKALISGGASGAAIDQMARSMKIPRDNVSRFYLNTMIYTHGLACFAAAGVLTATKEQIVDMINETAHVFLVQAANKAKN